ncbi:MAG: UDP-N-acetylmuramoyl-L-alanyl-D-glutamate--2,6-diaminopimelate ligase [Spirochaetales bacterium]|nr:UDP-N-acetylmuramoyl-L-alanyl-D-glutamate--2,6-diaminopimelate ligase [Spirochaetales bacterium]
MNQKRLASLLNEISIQKIQGNADVLVNGITYDSRRVKPGFIFTALPGFHIDGHRYIDNAIQNGAGVIIHEKERENHTTGITYIRVENVRAALSALSAAYFDHPSRHLAMIGVTGTDGKSTTVWFIHQLLEALGEKSGFLSTVQIKIEDQVMKNPLRQSTPEAPEIHEVLHKIRKAGKDIAIIEATSHGLSEQTKRLSHVDFDCAVLTNVTHEHLEFHGSFEQYRSDKANLFRMLDKQGNKKLKHGKSITSCGIINNDDPSGSFFRSVTKKRVCTYSVVEKDADLFAHSFTPDSGGTGFVISAGDYHHEALLNIPGLFNIENLLAACLAVCSLLNIHISRLVPFFPHLTGVPGRLIPIHEGQPFHVIVDYAHTPGSFEKIMPMMRQLTKGKLIAVFGSAGERDVGKRPMQGRIASTYCDMVVLTDEDPRLEDRYKILSEIAAGCHMLEKGKTLFLEPDRVKAISLAYSLAADNDDTILLLGKGHESSIIYPDGPVEWDETEVARRLLKEMKF